MIIPFVLAVQDVAGVPGPDLVPPLWRTLGALVVVLSLLAALAVLLKRGAFARRGAPGLNVESTLPLGDRRSLVVVAVEGRRLVLGLGPGHVTLVTELEARTFQQAVADATGDRR